MELDETVGRHFLNINTNVIFLSGKCAGREAARLDNGGCCCID